MYSHQTWGEGRSLCHIRNLEIKKTFYLAAPHLSVFCLYPLRPYHISGWLFEMSKTNKFMKSSAGLQLLGKCSIINVTWDDINDYQELVCNYLILAPSNNSEEHVLNKMPKGKYAHVHTVTTSLIFTDDFPTSTFSNWERGITSQKNYVEYLN